MRGLLVLMACVAVAYCDCNALHREKVKHQWNQAYHHNREEFGLAIWRHMFDEAPASKSYFSRVHVDDDHHPAFLAHSDRVLGGLSLTISALDDQATLDAELAHLKTQHDEREINPADFMVFKNALLHVVPALLGKCFDEHAWNDCFDEVIYPGITGLQA